MSFEVLEKVCLLKVLGFRKRFGQESYRSDSLLAPSLGSSEKIFDLFEEDVEGTQESIEYIYTYIYTKNFKRG